MTLSIVGAIQLASRIADGKSTLTDNLSLVTNLTNGTATGQANGYWSGTLTIPADDHDDLDLLALSFAAFGLTGTVALSAVKHLVVVNQSERVTLTVEPGPSNGWDQLDAVTIGKGGSFVLHSPIDGLPIGGSSRTLRLSNTGTVTTLAGDTTTGSAAVTALSSTSGLSVGMAVSGTGIPAGAKIATITNSTSLVLTANATATGTGVSLDFQWPAAVVKVYVAGILD